MPLLVSQVKNTAGWLWSEPRASAVTDVFDRGGPYLDVLLHAHFATVATFVPTDVDARIRHHHWANIGDPEVFREACAAIDRVAAHDVHLVSARVVDTAEGPLSGHDGEWLAVRAGALGRAAVLGLDLEPLVAQLDAELDREERALAEGTDAKTALSIVTIVAHNLGDLSRVAADWPKHEALASLRDRYVRLAHPDARTRRPRFVAAGTINKARMAHENHRFLPLRAARGLRASRDLILPIGPWFDAWGETVARHPLLEDRDRAEVLAALLEVHARDDTQEGCLRAIAGMHRATRGGIERYVPDLPARMRKDALRGRVRAELDVPPEQFAARIEKKYRAARDAA